MPGVMAKTMKRRSRIFAVLWTAAFVVLLQPQTATLARGAEVISPARERFAKSGFAKSDSHETPDFRRHVVPLLGRLGCNGRACHGSFQGQGGFRLSLFGYDFQADHQALTGGKEPRASAKSPAESLMLYKPTHEDEHGGGRRMEIGSWQFNLIKSWI